MHLFCAIGKWPKLEANGANVKFMRGGGEWRQIRPTCYIFFWAREGSQYRCILRHFFIISSFFDTVSEKCVKGTVSQEFVLTETGGLD